MKLFATSILAVATAAIKLSDGSLADECGAAPDVSQLTASQVFDFVNQDGSENIDQSELEGAIACAKHWGFLTDQEASDTVSEVAAAAGEDNQLSKTEAESVMDDIIARVKN